MSASADVARRNIRVCDAPAAVAINWAINGASGRDPLKSTFELSTGCPTGTTAVHASIWIIFIPAKPCLVLGRNASAELNIARAVPDVVGTDLLAFGS